MLWAATHGLIALRRAGIDAVVAVFGGARIPAAHDGGSEHPHATATAWAHVVLDFPAGLLGNPSDGYNGKTIAFSIRNLWAEVVLYEWDAVEIVLAEDDRARFSTVQDLARDVRLHGYYGGIRLIKATIKEHNDQVHHIPLHRQYIPWATRGNVEVVHRADNWLQATWVNIK